MRVSPLRGGSNSELFADDLIESLQHRAEELIRPGCFLLLAVFLFLFGVLAPTAHAQQCTTPPFTGVTIWLPYPPDLSLWPDYVGGQITPWYMTIFWDAPCLAAGGGTITVTSNYGQGPQTILVLPITSMTGTYDNGSPLQTGTGQPNPNGGLSAPPPVATVTSWTVNTIIYDGNSATSNPATINVLPLRMSIQLFDNKIVSAPGVTTPGLVALNAEPSPIWYPSPLSLQSSSPDVNVNFNWPQGGAGSALFTLSAPQDVTTAFSTTIMGEIDSSNGIRTTANAQLSVQPPGDPGPCDQDCANQAGSPLNLGTGNVWIQEKDYSVPGLGGGLQLTRTWNSKWQNLAPPVVAGLFGHSWQSNFEEQLYFPDPNSITYYRGDGSSWVFALTGPVAEPYWSLVSPSADVNARLTFAASQYYLTLPDGTQRVFSESGQLLDSIDRNGNQITLSYDQSNRLSSVTDAAGQSITFSYGDTNNPDQVTAAQDSVGVIASYAYDSNSRLVQVTYADGSSLNFTYGSNSMITSVTDGQGKVIESHSYDAADRGLTSSRANGADLVTVDYSTPDQTRLSDSLGNSTSYNLQYSGGRMLVNSVAGPGCASCGGRGAQNFSINPEGLISSATDALGNLACYTYDSGGDILSTTLAPPGSSCPGQGGVFDVAMAGPTAQAGVLNVNGISQTGSAGTSPTLCTAGGASNSAQFCTFGNSVSSPAISLMSSTALSPMLALGPAYSSPGMATWRYTYNNFQEVTTATDPAGNTTSNNYDANGNLLSVTTPSPDGVAPGATTSFAYGGGGELTQVTDPNGNLTTLTYTPAGLVDSITDAEGNTTTYTYDARGNRLSSNDVLHNTTTYTYDVMNRLTRTTAPDGSTTSYSYDYRGRRTSVTDANGKTTSYQYDDADRLTAVTDAAGHVTSYQYNTEDELTAIADAAGHSTSFTYDPLAHVTQVRFPSGLTESYAYDADENLLSKTDRKGNTINYAYDFFNRLTSKAYPDGTSVNYTYDVLGHLTQVTDPTGTYSFVYDNLGRLTSASTQYSFLSGQTLTNSYTYDADSNRISLTNPQGGVNNYTYDSLNRLTSLTDFAARTFTFAYDTLGRRTSLNRPNGVNTTYSYDELSRLLSVLHQVGGGTIDGASYTYDSAGNRISETVLPSSLTSAYSYDPAYELTQVMQGTKKTEAYTYDAVGNRTYQPGAPYTYNSSNEMLTREGVPYAYDANGNTLKKTNGSGTTSYAWDFENRLVGVALPAGGGSISMRYDPFGRRIYKSAPAGTTIYVYDGNNSIEELSGTGALQERYTYGPGIDEPLVGQRQPKIFYYEADGLGSITSLTDPTGAVAATYTYDSFGFLTNSTGSATNWFRYTARQFDSDTALYNYRARYYDPTTGRFLSEDPARFDAGINFYSYALNSPISWKDPSGRNVTVYYYPGSPLNPFGHVGLAVNDNPSVGFYPLVDLLPTNVAYGPGIVKADTQTPTNWVTVPTTPEQDAAIQQYINSHGGFSNGNYSFVSRNCTRFVEKALAAGGVASSNTAYPRTLIQDLNDLYNPPVLVPLNVQQQLDNPGLFYLSQ